MASAEQFKKVGDIIRSDSERKYVVPSAPGKRYDGDTKVTDMLYACYAKAEGGEKFGAEISVIDLATGFSYDMNDPTDSVKWLIWHSAMEAAEMYYFQLIEAGAKPEEARSVLPNSLKSEIVITMNLREWRHFIRLRGSRAAHPQIAEITAMIRDEFIKRYPVFFEDLEGCHE